MIAPGLDAKHQKNLDKAVKKMQKAGVNETAVKVFISHYQALVSGATGIIRESEILPLKSLSKLDDIDVKKKSASEALKKTAIIKLNARRTISLLKCVLRRSSK